MPYIVRSILAIFAGVIAVVVLSEGTDAILRVAGVFPPDPKAPHTNEMLAAATTYRTLAGVVGGYATAMLAPDKPMLHATVLGMIGLALGLVGVYVNVAQHLGPDWYPIALAVTAFPSTWIGGRLRSAPKKANQS
jgi:hypothetical protein